MLHRISSKTLYDQRRALLAWALGLVLWVGMYAALWPSIRNQPAMSDFLNKMPEALRALFAASGADMSTPTGYVQVELLSFMAPILLLIYAVTAGASAIAGEEDRRTADLLFASPVSRRRVVLDKLAAMVVAVVGLCTVVSVALFAEGTPAGMGLPAGKVVATMIHLALLAIVFGCLALAVGAGTGKVGLARAVPAAVAVVAYVMNALGDVVSWLGTARVVSPFYQYIGHDPLQHGISWPAVGVAAGTAAVLVLIAIKTFERRDIAG